MVRLVKHKNKEYVVITTTFHTDDVDTSVQIQISLSNVDPKHHNSILRQATHLLNRPLRLLKPQPKPIKTSLFKRIFGINK